MSKFRNRLLIAGTAALVLLAGACGSSKKAAAPPPPTTAPAAVPTTLTPATQPPASGSASPLPLIGAAKPDGLTVSLARSTAGIFLIGPNGHSLYVFDHDHGTTSGCTGSCAAVWPALTSASSISAGSVINQSQVSKATGQVANQVTYYGHLLYYFAGDQTPGQTNGTSIPGWHLLGPFGNVMLPKS